MREDARKVAAILRGREKVKVVTHIDADGICAGAVASLALDRAGVKNDVAFVKQLDPESVAKVRDDGALLWFTDLGSGSLDMLSGLDCVIADHHTPNGSFSVPSVNPHLHGLSGAQELSGAGAAYLVAAALDPANADLAALAIVGAVGDLQDARDCRLTGLNREVLEDGRRAGVLDWHIDLRYFGRETRPVHKMLQYSSDPAIPEITGSEEGALSFLSALGIRLKDGEQWRSWARLDDGEKRLVASRLVEHLLSYGVGGRTARRMLGEVYTLTNEEGGTPLRDAKEFATLLNSCGRHERPRLGLEVCRGDRGDAYRRALSLLQDHRRSLVEGIQLVKDLGIRRMEFLQWFDAGAGIQDTLVGVVAGMLLGSGEGGADPNLPMIAFARAEDGSGIKVSARAARALVDKGLDLSAVMRTASAAVGGSGGGHNVAAGGLVPEGAQQRFLEEADKLIRAQLSPL
jgi:RecJ-like exonuclease